ncbi:hypothetical protein G6F46_000113 [Rhizopus delemar]|uniref:Uncharacterized protein n=3 Tax=Rhizopus TaxID=4842 RepID=I1C130_RHIO9|nr:hypothetical protein RO3G_06865 [Rhizopus delemar RA 99-880]KAG1057969.1 hypothetical protein G6F43_000213 [Rhizopus delemar]KAG1554105.1 hypothetical protein G6F51_000155 [Rhizopus arrhizus]KAG1463740.1 hypothetical protein G6F55_002210 [Rhizopus delemar]KAG1505664.1 hypothetical protein G6F54_000166 [Rhizopus delemar]|eukprot:EIE82160.1 hypothetical protein RO3G_06865 [Rhizopus delemar RA 99-880]
MVKLALFAATIAALSTTSMAQTNVPTDLAAEFSSLMSNPTAMKSMLAEASSNVAYLPSQYQASAYSALAKASDSVSNLPAGKSAGNSINSHSNKPIAFAAALITVVFGVGMLM